MYRLLIILSLILGPASVRPSIHPAPAVAPANPTQVQSVSSLEDCRDLAWSSEASFISQAGLPPDGDPIIRDGDLLSAVGTVCMRNAELLQAFGVTQPMGLDAVDVIDVAQRLVAFSVELNAPDGAFKHGDLLNTWGAIIPIEALLHPYEIQGDRGLDAVHFIGELPDIIAFNEKAAELGRDAWIADPNLLFTELQNNNIDIWFSIEGSENAPGPGQELDGDVLSVLSGTIARNDELYALAVPAGIPSRGIDYGVDALSAQRRRSARHRATIRYSPEIMFHGATPFQDADVLRFANGIVYSGVMLATPFEPPATLVGTDAVYIRLDPPPQLAPFPIFMPLVLRHWSSREVSR